MATPAASPFTSRYFCSFHTAATLHWTTLTVSFDSVASCHQFISEDSANCGFSFLCLYAVQLQFSSVDACSPQSPYRGVHRNQGSSPPITGSGLHSLQQPSTPTFFPYSNSYHQYLHSFLLSLGIHWACASCTIPLQPSSVPTLEPHTAQYTLVFHITQSVHNSIISVGPSISCSRSFITFLMPRATNKSPNALQWHNFLSSLHHMMLHKYRMQFLHADESNCDDSSHSGDFPAQIQNCRFDWRIEPL